MTTRTLSLDDLEELRMRLIPRSHLTITHDPIGNLPDPWKVVLAMENNVFPHWMMYRGETPAAALGKLLDYLDGRLPDHATDPRLPAVWLK